MGPDAVLRQIALQALMGLLVLLFLLLVVGYLEWLTARRPGWGRTHRVLEGAMAWLVGVAIVLLALVIVPVVLDVLRRGGIGWRAEGW